MLSAELINAVLAATNDGLVVAEIKDGTTSIIFANPVFLQMTEHTLAEISGQECAFPLQSSPDAEARQFFIDALLQKNGSEIKIRLQTKTGKRIWVALRTVFFQEAQNHYAMCFYKDITQEEYLKSVLDKVNVLYREMSKRLEYTNETDHLTQLKNRGHLCTRGEFMLGAAKREKLRLHAILVDVDSFRVLNTIGGQALGDECLIRVADVIRNYFCRATDIAIRMGDDEFAIICIEDDDQRVHERAQLLKRDVRALQVKDFSGRVHNISVSIGIYSVTPEKQTTIEDMMQKAGELIFNMQNSKDQIVHTHSGDSTHSLRH